MIIRKELNSIDYRVLNLVSGIINSQTPPLFNFYLLTLSSYYHDKFLIVISSMNINHGNYYVHRPWSYYGRLEISQLSTIAEMYILAGRVKIQRQQGVILLFLLSIKQIIVNCLLLIRTLVLLKMYLQTFISM